uniref:FERM domain-containing protein n=1 Tax=Hucho hucho TaxID=62062 RepID=A0A4W5MHB3_9TELE
SSWIISVELAIGPEEGISYLTDKGSTVSYQGFPLFTFYSHSSIHFVEWYFLPNSGVIQLFSAVQASQEDDCHHGCFILCFLFCPGVQPTHLANFTQIQTIQYSSTEDKVRQGMLLLNVAGAPEPLTVTTASLNTAENMADLIDGYCRLVNKVSRSFIVRVQKGTLTLLLTPFH